MSSPNDQSDTLQKTSKIGGKSDWTLQKYLESTSTTTGHFKPLTLRERLGFHKRFLKDWLATVREMTREAFFHLKHMSPHLKPSPAVAMAFLRKRAHVLEKNLMKLHGTAPYRQEEKLNLARQARLLIENLTRTSSEAPDNTFPWVLRLLKEHEWNRDSQWCCDKMFIPKTTESKQTELLSLLRRRRSIRVFQKKPVSSEHIDLLIEAATHAPSSCNRQSWHFLAITDQAGKELVSRSAVAGHPWMMEAPLLIMTLMDSRAYRVLDDRFTLFQDSALVNGNILLMAEALGLGACWVTYNSFSNEKGIDEVRQHFKIPDYIVFAGIMVCGYPAQWVCPIPKLSTTHVLHKETFQ